MSEVSILQGTVSNWRQRSGAAGVSAAVRLNGRLHWASTESGDGVLAAAAQFPIYSITKTLTAICVLRLWETGTLDVSDPVRKWLPALGVPDEMTLVHLLRHTSGLGDYGPLPEYHNAVRSRPGHPWTRQQFLDAVLSKGLLFAPGDSWAYSNIGYMLLLQILERATGQNFAKTLRHLITTPLALQRTFVLEGIEDWSTCVPGFGSEVDIEGRVVDVRHVYHPGWCAPGVVASTAEEVTSVLDALISDNLLRPGTLAEMRTLVPIPGHHPPGVLPGCGMGMLSNGASPRGRNYGHGGGGPGYDLVVTVFPETRLGRVAVAVFVNSSGQRAEDCEAELLSRWLDSAA